MKQLKVSEVHTTPGEHDVTDGVGAEYFSRFGAASKGKGYYSFDHKGVHLVGLVNVMQFKPGGLASMGDEQMAWLKDDLAGKPSSQPIVLFAHMPMWSIFDAWGWGSSDHDQLMALIGRFGSVTVLNGHIHQIVSRVEGHVDLPHGAGDCLSAAGAGRGSRTWPADGSRRPTGEDDRRHQRPRRLAAQAAGPDRHPPRLNPHSERDFKCP